MVVATLIASFLTALSPSRRLDVHATVVDERDRPVVGAKVIVRTGQYMDLWTNGPAKKPIEDVATTGKGGKATASVKCYSGRFNVGALMDGYYPGGYSQLRIKTESDPDDPFSLRLLEHETNVTIRLRRKMNPIPMYAFMPVGHYFAIVQDGKEYAYDIKKRDFLPPDGKGETADFFVMQHTVVSNGVATSAGVVRFTDGAGAYIMPQYEYSPLKSVYCADTNAVFVSEIHFSKTFNPETNVEMQTRPIVGESEYLVLRTRVKRDENGRIVSANYSKIYGPFDIGCGLFGFKQSCFNPTPNDTNLEFDPNRNLVKRQLGKFQP